MNNSNSQGSAIFLIISLLAPLAWAEPLGQPTQDGAPAVYLDVDIQGRILEVDLLSKTARKIGDISSIPSDSVFYQSGFSFGDREFALLFFRNVGPPERYVQTPFIFSRSDGTFQLTPLTINVAGDGGMVPLESSSVFTFSIDSETRVSERVIYDAVENRIRGTFDFRVSPYTINSEIIDGSYAYFAETTGTHVRKVSVSSGAVEQEFDVIDLVGTDEPGIGRNVWIRALYRNFALVKRRYKETQEARLFLIDVDSKHVVAQSESLPNFYGRFLLYVDKKDNLTVTCIENIVVESKLKVAGALRKFLIEGDSITPGKEESFDPESEIVVTDETGAPVIIPRYRFDYLSMREVQRQIFRRLGTAALGSIEERKRIRDEVIEEFNNPEQEGFTSRTLTHLEIR